MPWRIEMLHTHLMACRQTANATDALHLFEEASERHSMVVRNVTLKLILDTCARAKRLPEALALYERAVHDGFKPDVLTVNSVIRYCVAVQQPAKAFAAYTSAKERGMPPPNLMTLTTLSQSCSAASTAAQSAEERELWMRRSLELYTDGQALLADRSRLSYTRSAGRGH